MRIHPLLDVSFVFHPEGLRTWTDIAINPLALPSCVLCGNKVAGTGISTCCPSPTTFVLGLGPTNPGTINVAQETLVPAFSLPRVPPNFTVQLQHTRNAPLPLHINMEFASSAHSLSPVIFSVQDHNWPVSCYALFKCMAASKPTSWLTWGP